MKWKSYLAVTLNSTFQYIDEVLSINNQFHLHVHSIYPNEQEIKDTTESSISALHLYVFIEIGHQRQNNDSAL
jgi:hypothetical protein